MEYVVNGGFEANINSWTTGLGGADATWNMFDGHLTAGSAKIEAAGGNPTVLQQEIETPETLYLWRFTYSIKNAATLQYLEVELQDDAATSTVYHVRHEYDEVEEDVWLRFSTDLVLTAETIFRVYFEQPGAGGHWLVDDVSLEAIAELNNCRNLTLELMKRRHDLGAQKHAPGRYQEAIRRAIREAPLSLWQHDVDTSLSTVEETRRYSLAAITTIVEPRQVLNVYVEDANGHYGQIGRWTVEDDAGALTLVLDENPIAADRTLRLAYIIPYVELDCSDSTDYTDLDREWILAQAMTELLLEADPGVEAPELTARSLQLWDAKRQRREAEIMRRRPPGRARTKRRG